MVGELDYTGILVENIVNNYTVPGTDVPYVPLPTLTFCLFFVFVLMVSIVLVNLLVRTSRTGKYLFRIRHLVILSQINKWKLLTCERRPVDYLRAHRNGDVLMLAGLILGNENKWKKLTNLEMDMINTELYWRQRQHHYKARPISFIIAAICKSSIFWKHLKRNKKPKGPDMNQCKSVSAYYWS